MKKWWSSLNIYTKFSLGFFSLLVFSLPGVFTSMMEARATLCFVMGVAIGVQLGNILKLWSDSRMEKLREKSRPKEWWEKEVK